MPPERENHSYAALDPLIRPKSVAIIGLSAKPASFSARTAANLSQWGGRLYGVNPRETLLHGIPCHASIEDVPGPVDCAVVAVPGTAVEETLERCAAAGVRGCIVYASGFAETGKPEAIRAQERIRDLARGSAMRVIGPNCIGIIANAERAAMTFTAGYDAAPWRTGPVGFVSQSGALGFTMVQVVYRGGSYSHYLTAGNSADVDVCDQIAYLAEDTHCRVIACIVEGIASGARFVAAADKAMAAGKPVVLYKVATGQAAAEAALSHTGSLAGSDEAYRAAFRRHGIVQVDNLEQLYPTAALLAKNEAPRAPGAAVLAPSGGACVICVDKAELHGVPMPQPAAETTAVLEARVPDYGSARNPCDMTAQVAGDIDAFTVCADALLADPAYGSLVLVHPSISKGLVESRVPVVSSLARKHGKAVCVVWASEWQAGPGSELYEADERIALFRSFSDCFEALAGWRRWHEHRSRGVERAGARPHPGRAAAAALLAGAGEALSEREGKRLLAAYGIPAAADRLASGADEAARLAAEIGFPVVLKIESADIAHKTEVGGVRLGLADAGAVRQAWEEIMASARRHRPDARIAGVSVQEQVPSGIELVVGARADAQFGPLVVVGMGGVLVEILRDTASELAPVTPAQARRMLERLAAHKLLASYRGRPGADLDKVAQIVAAVSRLAADFPDDIAEIDVNPVICLPDRAVAADALVVRKRKDR